MLQLRYPSTFKKIVTRLSSGSVIRASCSGGVSSNMTKPLVLVTGPSGFVGAHVLRTLLCSGFRVRGTVRGLKRADFIKEQYKDQSSDLSFSVVPDIQAPGALDEAVADVDYICHVASPYFTSSNDPLQELIEPAVNGTKNVLQSALKAPNLKRITVLSSFASVVDLSKNPRPGMWLSYAGSLVSSESQAMSILPATGILSH